MAGIIVTRMECHNGEGFSSMEAAVKRAALLLRDLNGATWIDGDGKYRWGTNRTTAPVTNRPGINIESNTINGVPQGEDQ